MPLFVGEAVGFDDPYGSVMGGISRPKLTNQSAVPPVAEILHRDESVP